MKPFYQDNDCSLFCGDSAEVLKQFPDESIDLTVTSPPYDGMRTYKGFVFDFNSIAKELYRVTKTGGVVVWVVNDATIDGSETLTSCKQKIFFREQCGFNILDTMLYRSTKPPLTHRRYEQEFEYMFILSKGSIKTFNPLMIKCQNAGKSHFYGSGKKTDAKLETGDAMRYRREVGIVKSQKIKGNIWEYSTGSNSSNDEESFEHPAIYPEQLAKDHILSWSNEGDTVLDCFAGSGTTLKAAKILKRKSIGIEIAKEYCELIVRRINKPIPLFDNSL